MQIAATNYLHPLQPKDVMDNGAQTHLSVCS